MKITDVMQFPVEKLIANLRDVTMLKDKDVKPYENATIEVQEVDPDFLYPAQRYVLTKELEKVRDLEWALKGLGIDLFKLNGFVRIKVEGVEHWIDVLPPIVEETIERNGDATDIINDGMHRMMHARMSWVYPQCVVIRDVPKELPYYAYPIPDGDWDQVKILDSIPKTFIKKWHRTPDNKKLYRDFNSAFMNVGGPRGKG